MRLFLYGVHLILFFCLSLTLAVSVSLNHFGSLSRSLYLSSTLRFVHFGSLALAHSGSHGSVCVSVDHSLALCDSHSLFYRVSRSLSHFASLAFSLSFTLSLSPPSSLSTHPPFKCISESTRLLWLNIPKIENYKDKPRPDWPEQLGFLVLQKQAKITHFAKNCITNPSYFRASIN